MTDDSQDPRLEGELSTVMAGSAPLANLRALHMGGATYRVLSARNGSATLHKVDLADVDCTCGDMEYNQEGREICAHAAKAALVHPGQLDVETQAAHTLMQKADRMDSLLDQTRDKLSQLEQGMVSMRDVQAGQKAAETDDSPAQADATQSTPDPNVNALRRVREWLDEEYPQPQLVEVAEGPHGGTPGVRLEPDNQTMTETQYEMFKSMVNSVDGSTVHVGFTDEGCNQCSSGDDGFWYHLPTEAVEGL